MLLLWEKALVVTAAHCKLGSSARSIQYIAHLWHYVTALPLYHAPKQRLPKQFEQIFSSFTAHWTKPAFWCWCHERAWRISSPTIKDKLDPYSVLKRALQRKTVSVPARTLLFINAISKPKATSASTVDYTNSPPVARNTQQAETHHIVPKRWPSVLHSPVLHQRGARGGPELPITIGEYHIPNAMSPITYR